MRITLNIKRIIFLLLFLIICSILAMTIRNCSKFRTYESVEDKVFKNGLNEILKRADEKLNENEKAVFRLDTVTKFDWNRMYGFDGYVTADSIEKRTGVEWEFGDLMCVQSQDIILVFMRGDSVVSTVRYPEWDRNFISFSIGFRGEYAVPEKSIYCIYKQYDTEGNYRLELLSFDELDELKVGQWVKKRKLISLD